MGAEVTMIAYNWRHRLKARGHYACYNNAVHKSHRKQRARARVLCARLMREHEHANEDEFEFPPLYRLSHLWADDRRSYFNNHPPIEKLMSQFKHKPATELICVINQVFPSKNGLDWWIRKKVRKHIQWGQNPSNNWSTFVVDEAGFIHHRNP